MIAKTLAALAAKSDLIPLTTCAALLVFLSFFIGMLFWVRRKESRTLYPYLSQLPFESEKARR